VYPIENMRIDMNSLSTLLTMYHTKFYVVSDIFIFANDRIWYFNKIAPVEKMHKKNESGLFQEAIIFNLDIGLGND
jgi:hypothetical protein